MCDVLACGFGLTDNYPQTGFAIAFEKMQFLQPLENPEWQVDINAVRIEDIPIEIVRQSSSHPQLIDFGDPARPRVGSMEDNYCGGANHNCTTHRICRLFGLSIHGNKQSDTDKEDVL